MVHAKMRAMLTGRRALMMLTFAAALPLAPSRIDAQAKKAAAATPYVPPAGSWERRSPSAVGMDSAKLAAAVAFAIEKESKNPRDLLVNHNRTFGREPFGEPIGPIAPRGATSGVIVRHGYVVAEWGDPTAVEMTHSVTKSMLSSVVGVAVDRGIIHSVFDTVANVVGPILIAGQPTTGPQADRLADGRWL